MGRYRCHGPKCQGLFPAQAGGAVRCCGVDCEQQLVAQQQAIEDALRAAGFERDAQMSNAWRKDGAAVTVEECRHLGVQKVIEKHARIVHTN